MKRPNFAIAITLTQADRFNETDLTGVAGPRAMIRTGPGGGGIFSGRKGCGSHKGTTLHPGNASYGPAFGHPIDRMKPVLSPANWATSRSAENTGKAGKGQILGELQNKSINLALSL